MPTPYYEHQGVTIYHGDCLEVLPELDTEFTACITDPPYGIDFMGKEWDHGVPGVPFWEAIKRVLKPGAPLFAFSGTRTFHRQWCYIEDAGFSLRDTLSWMYAQGFPKSHDISKAIDEQKGAERKDAGPYIAPDGKKRTVDLGIQGGNWANSQSVDEKPEARRTAPATEDAERWDGWGSALKPSAEFICYATKPRDGTYAENALEHGVAGLNIDAVRIDSGEDYHNLDVTQGGDHFSVQSDEKTRHEQFHPAEGRWPPNTILEHTRWCKRVGTKKVEGSVRQRHKESPGGKCSPPAKQKKREGIGDSDNMEEVPVWDCPPSCPVRKVDQQQGNASRFFYTSKADSNDRTKGMPDGAENPHPTVKPTDLIGWLCKLASYPGRNHILDPFAGSGPLAYVAAQLGHKATLIEQDEESAELCALRLQGQQSLFALPEP